MQTITRTTRTTTRTTRKRALDVVAALLIFEDVCFAFICLRSYGYCCNELRAQNIFRVSVPSLSEVKRAFQGHPFANIIDALDFEGDKAKQDDALMVFSQDRCFV